MAFKKSVPNPVRADPTGTIGIRRAYHNDLTKRLNAVRDDLLAELDPAIWPHKTARQRVADIRRWLNDAIARYVDRHDVATNEPWAAKYVRQAYQQGAQRAYAGVMAAAGKPLHTGPKLEQAQARDRQAAFMMGLKRRYEETGDLLVDMADNNVQTIASAVKDWVLKDALTLIRTKQSMTKLKAAIRNAFSRTLANKGALGVNDDAIAAHAEGQLDAFEDLGVPAVGIRAEFKTVGDQRVCPECKSMEGQVYSIEEARGIIPVHPRCRCSWVPVVYRKRVKRIADAVRTAVGRIERGRRYEPPLRKFGVRFGRATRSLEKCGLLTV